MFKAYPYNAGAVAFTGSFSPPNPYRLEIKEMVFIS